MKTSWIATLAFLATMPLAAVEATNLADYLPQGMTYSEDVPVPASVLGYQVGEWHVRPGQLEQYGQALAAASERVRFEIQGTTYEGRPQPLLIITSPANHARMDEILRSRHRLTSLDKKPVDLQSMPVIVTLGYSIHGNEPSGANASLLSAYHFAAGQGPEMEALLAETVVLIDPSLNPDGLGRFAHWANTHKGRMPVADRQSREHLEAWPRGRTNHYWFDLNRDWLLLQHPESRNRVATFQRFRPNVLGDFHEMGSNSTYFFQPGVQSRVNPLIPAKNQELTGKLAAFHAAALDEAGTLYYSEETFDDFYPGKGSTYPDLNGGVGVLFEQASARGHRMENPSGPFSFQDSIQNQFTTSLSLVAGAHAHRSELLEYQGSFFRQAAEEARADSTKGYLFGGEGDPIRPWELKSLLEQHGIRVDPLAAETTVEGQRYVPDHSWIVPLEQPSYRLIKALFERNTQFQDSTFYDISAWSMGDAFGLLLAHLDAKTMRSGIRGSNTADLEPPSGRFPAEDAGSYAHLMEWDSFYAPRALAKILDEGLRARVATRSFTAVTDQGQRSFDPGTILVEPSDKARDVLRQLAVEDRVNIYALSSGRTPEGIDMGSPRMRPLKMPKPALVVGNGVQSYAAGEIWHLLDFRFGMELPLLELDRLQRTDLTKYTHLIFVDGQYRRVEENLTRKLRRWVREGGIVIATQSAADWAGALVNPDAEGESSDRSDSEDGGLGGESTVPQRRPYGDFAKDRGAQVVGGAIFEAQVDLTHPLLFGFRHPRTALFRNSAQVLSASENPYENVGVYTDSPLLAGYISQRNLDRIAGSAAILVHRVEQGAVIRLADNPAFRAFWLGPSRQVLNGIYFGQAIEPTPAPTTWKE